jgi:MurNAc alpha-1-phosphate uridylyltransferase
MRPLTDTRPKPLIEVAGRALIDHALALAEGEGLARIAVNAHYRADQIAAHLAARPEIKVIVEAPEILETGGGLKNALPHLGEGPVYTLNSDAVWAGPNPLAFLRAAWEPEKMDALVLLIPREAARGHGGRGDFFIDGAGQLTRGPGLVYAGAQIVNPARLADIPKRIFSLNMLWDKFIAEDRLFGAVYPGLWCDVGTPAAIPLAEAMLKEAGLV